MNRSDIPNIISIIRILLAPVVAWLLLIQRFDMALILFGIAGFSDALDGFLAKRFGWTSRLGALLDPLADKALVALSFLALAWLGLVPLWLVAVVVLRDVVIVTGAITYHFRIEPLDASPTWISKINTTAQIVLVLAVVFYHGIMAFPDIWLQILIYTVLVTTVMSGLDYIWTWTFRARKERDESGNGSP